MIAVSCYCCLHHTIIEDHVSHYILYSVKESFHDKYA